MKNRVKRKLSKKQILERFKYAKSEKQRIRECGDYFINLLSKQNKI